ncbi:unnamed protein product [Penicillium manginii]
MQHASTVRLDKSEMVREVAKDTDPASIGSEKAAQDGFTDVMEELSDCHRVYISIDWDDLLWIFHITQEPVFEGGNVATCEGHGADIGWKWAQ